MKLCDYLASIHPAARANLAAHAQTTMGHLQNVAYGLRRPSAGLATAIERQTAGAVMRWDLRPDDWHLIWPELIGTEGAPVIPEAAQIEEPAP